MNCTALKLYNNLQVMFYQHINHGIIIMVPVTYIIVPWSYLWFCLWFVWYRYWYFLLTCFVVLPCRYGTSLCAPTHSCGEWVDKWTLFCLFTILTKYIYVSFLDTLVAIFSSSTSNPAILLLVFFLSESS